MVSMSYLLPGSSQLRWYCTTAFEGNPAGSDPRWWWVFFFFSFHLKKKRKENWLSQGYRREWLDEIALQYRTHRDDVNRTMSVESIFTPGLWGVLWQLNQNCTNSHTESIKLTFRQLSRKLSVWTLVLLWKGYISERAFWVKECEVNLFIWAESGWACTLL